MRGAAAGQRAAAAGLRLGVQPVRREQDGRVEPAPRDGLGPAGPLVSFNKTNANPGLKQVTDQLEDRYNVPGWLELLHAAKTIFHPQHQVSSPAFLMVNAANCTGDDGYRQVVGAYPGARPGAGLHRVRPARPPRHQAVPPPPPPRGHAGQPQSWIQPR